MNDRRRALEDRQRVCNRGVACWTAETPPSACGCSCRGRYHGEWGDYQDAAKRLDHARVPKVPASREGLAELLAFRRDVEVVKYATDSESGVTLTMRAVRPRCDRLLADVDREIDRVESKLAEWAELSDLSDDELDAELGLDGLDAAERELARDEFRVRVADPAAARRRDELLASRNRKRRPPSACAVAARPAGVSRGQRRADEVAVRDEVRARVRAGRQQHPAEPTKAEPTKAEPTKAEPAKADVGDPSPQSPGALADGPATTTPRATRSGSVSERSSGDASGSSIPAASTPPRAADNAAAHKTPSLAGGNGSSGADGDARRDLERLAAERRAEQARSFAAYRARKTKPLPVKPAAKASESPEPQPRREPQVTPQPQPAAARKQPEPEPVRATQAADGAAKQPVQTGASRPTKTPRPASAGATRAVRATAGATRATGATRPAGSADARPPAQTSAKAQKADTRRKVNGRAPASVQTTRRSQPRLQPPATSRAEPSQARGAGDPTAAISGGSPRQMSRVPSSQTNQTGTTNRSSAATQPPRKPTPARAPAKPKPASRAKPPPKPTAPPAAKPAATPAGKAPVKPAGRPARTSSAKRGQPPRRVARRAARSVKTTAAAATNDAAASLANREPDLVDHDSVDELVVFAATVAVHWVTRVARGVRVGVETAGWVAADWVVDMWRRLREPDWDDDTVVDVEPAAIEPSTSRSAATQLFYQQIGLTADPDRVLER